MNTDFTLNNCLFETFKLNKNPDSDKYKYTCYGIGFDSRSKFPLPDGTMGKNVITFWAHMSSSVHIDNEGKDILIIGKGTTQGSNATTLTTEAIYAIYFTPPNKRFVLSPHYQRSNSLLFLNATKIYQFKAKKTLKLKIIHCV